jgi:hypothetical protein
LFASAAGAAVFAVLALSSWLTIIANPIPMAKTKLVIAAFLFMAASFPFYVVFGV